MEPTIYKPSIYKGAGIYNTGAGGGGDCVEIAGKYYKTKKINNKLWITENLSYQDSTVNKNTNLSSYASVIPALNYFNTGALVYLTNNASNLFDGWRVANKDDYQELKDNFSVDDLLSVYNYGNNSSGLNFECTGSYYTNFQNTLYIIFWTAQNNYNDQNIGVSISMVDKTFDIANFATKELFCPIRLVKDV